MILCNITGGACLPVGRFIPQSGREQCACPVPATEIPFHHDPICFFAKIQDTTIIIPLFIYERYDEYKESYENINHFSAHIPRRHIPGEGLLFPYFISYAFLSDAVSDHLLVPIEGRGSAFDFQKNDFIQAPFRKSIEDKIIDSFPKEDQIFVMIWEIRKQGSYLLMDVSEDDIAGSIDRIAPITFQMHHEIQFGKQISDYESDDYSDDDQPKLGIHEKRING